MSALLAVQDLSRSFGGVRALDRCTLTVDAGTVTGLI
jgi:ABC-type branched-subunit amino acid transport system ATPase component